MTLHSPVAAARCPQKPPGWRQLLMTCSLLCSSLALFCVAGVAWARWLLVVPPCLRRPLDTAHHIQFQMSPGQLSSDLDFLPG